jgi:putative hydrolase of the HAD superfamily
MTSVLFVFDVDDTLYLERDYSRSALNFLGSAVHERYDILDASQKLISMFDAGDKDAIGRLWEMYDLPVADKAQCIQDMQTHMPTIKMNSNADAFLSKLRVKDVPYALVTDGRATTQRRKISALGLQDAAVISISGETGFMKPAPEAFASIVEFAQDRKVVFVGDNPKKDFLFANMNGWTSVMLRAGNNNVHSQELPHDKMYHPQITIDCLSELETFL